MASVFKEEHLKDYILMRDVVYKYHPEYINDSHDVKIKNLSRAKMGHLNIEHIVEDLISIVSGIGRTNKTGMDFVDGSDAKVCSMISPWPSRPYAKRWTIHGVESKVGWLRTIIFKGFDSEQPFAFFCIPVHKKEAAFKRYTGKNGKMKIQGVYRQEFDLFDDIEDYRVSSFNEMCEPVEHFENNFNTNHSNVYNFAI